MHRAPDTSRLFSASHHMAHALPCLSLTSAAVSISNSCHAPLPAGPLPAGTLLQAPCHRPWLSAGAAPALPAAAPSRTSPAHGKHQRFSSGSRKIVWHWHVLHALLPLGDGNTLGRCAAFCRCMWVALLPLQPAAHLLRAHDNCAPRHNVGVGLAHGPRPVTAGRGRPAEQGERGIQARRHSRRMDRSAAPVLAKQAQAARHKQLQGLTIHRHGCWLRTAGLRLRRGGCLRAAVVGGGGGGR